jgi:hypothetical protein
MSAVGRRGDVLVPGGGTLRLRARFNVIVGFGMSLGRFSSSPFLHFFVYFAPPGRTMRRTGEHMGCCQAFELVPSVSQLNTDSFR